MRCTELTLIPTASAIIAPVQCVASAGGSVKVSFNHPLGHLGRQRRNTRGPGLVAQQALYALFGKAFLPAPDASLGLAGLAHDRVGAHTRGAEQHDTGSPNVLLRRVPIPHQRFKPQPVGGRKINDDSWSHATHSHTPTQRGIPSGFNRQILSTSRFNAASALNQVFGRSHNLSIPLNLRHISVYLFEIGRFLGRS